MPSGKWEAISFELNIKDLVIAAKIRRVLDVWVASCRQAQLPGSQNVFPQELLVKDPLPVSTPPHYPSQ